MSPLPSDGHPPLPPSLIEALGQARQWGFLGDGPLDVAVAHAQGFADAADSATTGGAVPAETPDAQPDGEAGAGPWMDLGSGGGIPGLVLAHRWTDREAVLLDSSERRTRFLEHVIAEQGWGHRVRVVTLRAEEAGRTEGLRGAFSLVVARSFGPPPVTAECAAPFLRVGGILIVSEPPGDDYGDARWPEKGLASLGLEPLAVRRDSFGYRLLRQTVPCPERFPRRVGVPAKRPLYRVGGPPSSG
jgi:16S rRNA (guanine527-N7)-methyltransferase